MKRNIPCLLALTLAALACNASDPRPAEAGAESATAASAMPADIRADIAAGRQQMLRAFRDNDPAMLNAVLARPETAGDPAVFNSLRERVRPDDLAPVAELYTTLDPGTERILTTAGADRLRVTVPAEGSAAVVVLSGIPGGFRDSVLAELWVRGPEGWKLLALRLGAWRVGGKTGMEWYREAEGLRDRDMHLAAWLRLRVAADLMRPVPFVEYAEADSVQQRLESVGSRLTAAHAFPMTLADLPQTPQVLSIEPAFPEGQLSPAVRYVTRYALVDADLGKEAQQVADALGGIFSGFCEGTTHVALAAYSEPPVDPGKQYASTGLVATCP